ncbi:hypothetical protein K490DRAFT_15921, partial [Saccharata proteae CBS 121410]
FPIFASYKALRTADPAQLTPWLMYWVVFTIAQTGEYYFSPFISWFPFYAWIRLGAYCWLVMPGSQGATMLYQQHVHPFLSRHEREIDVFISDAHENARRAGIQYLNQAIEWFKVSVLGMQPRQPSPPQSRQTSGTYVQNLISRFNMPTAREGLAAPAGDIYGLLSAALQGVSAGHGSGARELHEDLSASGHLIPPGVAGGSDADRYSYISAQRERLRTLLSAFDQEADNLQVPRSGDRTPLRERSRERYGDLGRSKSELEFDRVEYDEAEEEARERMRGMGHRTTSGGWMPWQWGGAQPPQ